MSVYLAFIPDQDQKDVKGSESPNCTIVSVNKLRDAWLNFKPKVPLSIVVAARQAARRWR